MVDTIEWERVARAALHPTALAILELMSGPPPEGRPGWSVSRMVEPLDLPLKNVWHHVRVLREKGLLVEVGRAQVDGRPMVETFYALAGAGAR